MSGREEAWPSGAMSVTRGGTSGLWSGRRALLLKAHCWVLSVLYMFLDSCFPPFPTHISPDVNYEELARCTDDFNGAQCKAVCVEAVSVPLQPPALTRGNGTASME